jgi:hypothetical protein
LKDGDPFAVPHGFFYNYEAFEELFGEDFQVYTDYFMNINVWN